MLTEEEY